MLEMPVLKPIPIRTREVGWIIATWRWITKIRQWKLVEEWHHRLPDKTEIVIPPGFVFDGASIPRPFWAILSPVGLLLLPGLIHDFGYRYNFLLRRNAQGALVRYKEGEGRRFWDRLFREVAIQVNSFRVINWIAWLALWAFGCFAWCARRKKSSPIYWLRAEAPHN